MTPPNSKQFHAARRFPATAQRDGLVSAPPGCEPDNSSDKRALVKSVSKTAREYLTPDEAAKFESVLRRARHT